MAIIHYLVFILTVYLELITINYDRSIIQSFFFFCLFFSSYPFLLSIHTFPHPFSVSFFFPSFFCLLSIKHFVIQFFFPSFFFYFPFFLLFIYFFFSFYYSSFCHPILPYSSVFPLFFSLSFLFCTKIKIEDRKERRMVEKQKKNDERRMVERQIQ